MTTGARIKAARKAAGMTQAELANRLGIPYQSIGQWENDLRNPKYETLQKIADALGVTVLYLMGNPDFESLEEAQNTHSRYVDDSRWEKITEDILISIYGKKREIPLELNGAKFIMSNLTVYGEKPGNEVEIGSDEIHVIACALRSVFFTLIESLGRTVEQAIKEDEDWINGPHGLISILQLLPDNERQTVSQKIVERVSDLANGTTDYQKPKTPK